MRKQNNNPRGESENFDSGNQSESEQWVTGIETDLTLKLENPELEEARQLAVAIRESADADLPDVGPELRKLLEAKLDEQPVSQISQALETSASTDANSIVDLKQADTKPVVAKETLKPNWSKRLAIAASLLALVGTAFTLMVVVSNDYFRSSSRRAKLYETNQPPVSNYPDAVKKFEAWEAITDPSVVPSTDSPDNIVLNSNKVRNQTQPTPNPSASGLAPGTVGYAPVLQGESPAFGELQTALTARDAFPYSQTSSGEIKAKGYVSDIELRESEPGFVGGPGGTNGRSGGGRGGNDSKSFALEKKSKSAQANAPKQFETRTRTIPLTRWRKETKTRQLADGTIQNYEVKVPFTENVTQSYAFEVTDDSLDLASDKPNNQLAANGIVGLVKIDSPKDFGLTVREKVLSTERVSRAMQRAQLESQLKRATEDLSKLGPNHRDVIKLTETIAAHDKRVEQLLGAESAGEQYDSIIENQFKTTKGASALSTFSIDVDTASYSNMRRMINQGGHVPPNAIRIEELVNYFNYDYPQPKGDDPFSVNMEMATCPWNEQHKLLRVGLKGKEIHRDERPASNIVFLLDVSGSMQSADKLPLLKAGFQMMVKQLKENDRVSIVTYAGNAGVALQPTSGDQKAKLLQAIEKLTAGGSTNGSQGIELAYQLAQKHFIKDGTNKVILATDGDLNVGITSDGGLVKLIKEKASEGVFLSVLGFGTGNLKDGKMEKLADNGNGMYSYIDGMSEAYKVLVENMSGSLVTIAKDVKIQIEFNPSEVKAYRLIGYENRVLAAKDFDDDKKDAGEIGAGHTVTALYELVTNESAESSTVTPTKLKYQTGSDEEASGDVKITLSPKKNQAPGELLTLALRYKQPDENESKRIEFTLKDEANTFSTASADFKFASSVAAFGMLLRGSKYSGAATKGWVQEVATGSMGEDRSGYRREFVDLVRRYNQSQASHR